MTSRICTNYVQELSSKVIGIRLAPLDFRHIRGTHFYHSVMSNEDLGAAEKSSALEKYAASVGQTVEILRNHYVYFNPQQLASVSIENTAYANSFVTDGLASPLDFTL